MAEQNTLEWVQGRAGYLKSLSTERDRMFDEIDEAINGDWELPAELQKVDWAMRAPDPSFAITVDAAIRIVTDLDPDISIVPTSADKVQIADAHEKAVRWFLANASKRSSQPVMGDISTSAGRYGEVAAEVIFLPEQIKGVQKAKGNASRWESMQRNGPFVINLYHPRSVYPRCSALGLEEICMTRQDDPHAIVDLWGDKANALKERMSQEVANGVSSPVRVLYNVYMSYDRHTVWVEWGENGGDAIEIHDGKWPWPFLPWACRKGGSNLEDDSARKRNPLLKTMFQFDMYDLMSRVRSLRYSDMLRTAAAPRKVWQATGETEAPSIVGSAGEEYERIGEDETIVYHPATNPDPSMATLHAELKTEHQKATLSDLLLGGSVPSESAFASINLVTHSALTAVKPTQDLIRGVTADIVEIMLLWIHYAQASATGYEKQATGEYVEALVHWEDIDPKNLYITVDTTADLPTDKQGRILGAEQLIRTGLYSVEAAMNDVGVKDASKMRDDVAMDRMLQNMLEIDLKNEQYMSDIQVRERLKQELLPEVMQMVMQQMQAQGGPGGRPALSGPAPTGNPVGAIGAQGPEMPPTGIPPEAAPMEGSSMVPAQFNPEATREAQSGRGPDGENVRVR